MATRIKKTALLWTLAAVASAAAQEKKELPEVLRTLALAQRDYAIARAQVAEKTLALQEATAKAEQISREAEAACAAKGKRLDVQSANCVDKK